MLERELGIPDDPDIQRAAVIIAQAKVEARRIFPGEDAESLQRRYELASLIIDQFTSSTNGAASMVETVDDGAICTPG